MDYFQLLVELISSAFEVAIEVEKMDWYLSMTILAMMRKGFGETQVEMCLIGKIQTVVEVESSLK